MRAMPCACGAVSGAASSTGPTMLWRTNDTPSAYSSILTTGVDSSRRRSRRRNVRMTCEA